MGCTCGRRPLPNGLRPKHEEVFRDTSEDHPLEAFEIGEPVLKCLSERGEHCGPRVLVHHPKEPAEISRMAATSTPKKREVRRRLWHPLGEPPLLDRRRPLCEDRLVVDGIYGPKTRGVLATAVAKAANTS